ncbi:phage portal protein family protein, partial [Acinetobacter chengduensis]
YWLFFFKQNGFKFWAKFLERFGTPILLGKCKDTETVDMNEALLNAHAQSVLSIDVEDDVQVLSTQGSGSANGAFETFNKTLAQQIQKLVLGQTLTSGTDGKGSYALGQVHENVRTDKLKSDMRLVTPTLQAVVNALCELNNWAEHTIVLGEEAKVLNTEQAERDTRLKNAGANFSDAYFIREYGLQEGDLKTATEPVQQTFSALPKPAFSFKASVQKQSPEQQEVEELTDGQGELQLLTNEQIKQLAAESDTPEALLFNLTRLIPDATQSQFNAQLDQALYAADVLGYATAAKGK